MLVTGFFSSCHWRNGNENELSSHVVLSGCRLCALSAHSIPLQMKKFGYRKSRNGCLLCKRRRVKVRLLLSLLSRLLACGCFWSRGATSISLQAGRLTPDDSVTNNSLAVHVRNTAWPVAYAMVPVLNSRLRNMTTAPCPKLDFRSTINHPSIARTIVVSSRYGPFSQPRSLMDQPLPHLGPG